MKSIRTFLMWLLLLTKRLYKKPAFLAIIILIPAVILAYSLVAQNDSGMMTVVLSAQDPQNHLSERLIKEFENSSDIIRFIHEEDPVVAEEMVYNGVADSAWIVSADIETELKAFVSGHYTGKGFVRVVVREETVPILLANEKLSGKLFVECARTCFVDHLRENESALKNTSDEELLKYFDNISFNEELFDYSYVSGAASEENARNYLLMPVRGLLSILVVIGAMAAAMFYMADEQSGLFSRVSLRKKQYVELGCQIIAVTNVMLVVLVALIAARLNVALYKELLVSVCYICSCAVFGQLIRLLCRNLQGVGMLIPLLSMVMLVICPVFISIPGITGLQLLFPPTYYLNAIYDLAYAGYMILYTVGLWLIYKCCAKLLK